MAERVQAYQVTLTAKEIEALLTKVQNMEHELKDSDNPICAGAVYAKFEELKKSVSDGKSLVASAITEKGIDTATTNTFQELANNILAISTSKESSVDTDVIHIAEGINEYENARKPNVYYFGNINTEESATIIHHGVDTDVDHIAENINEYENARKTNVYYFHNVNAEDAIIIPWNHYSTEITNERKEY